MPAKHTGERMSSASVSDLPNPGRGPGAGMIAVFSHSSWGRIAAPAAGNHSGPSFQNGDAGGLCLLDTEAPPTD